MAKLPWCFEWVPADSSDWLREDSLVAIPDEPGRESPNVVEGEVTGGETCGVNAVELSSGSTLSRGAVASISLVGVPSSVERVAAGVIGGECIDFTTGL